MNFIMKKRVIAYIVLAIAFLLVRLLYVHITQKPYFEGAFVSTLIGGLAGIIIVDTVIHINDSKK